MSKANVLAFLKSTTARLAGSYLVIIMILSIGFSVVFYNTSARELGKQIPPAGIIANKFGISTVNGDNGDFHQFFQDRIDKGRGELLTNLVLINLCALVLGTFLSYYLARRTLEPIEQAMDAQSRFASDASHELRTPLAVIQTENEVALRKPDLTLIRAKELLASNLEEVTRLKALSEGLLRLARNHSGAPHQPLWIDDIASEAVNRVLKAAQAKHISIDESAPHAQVLGDTDGLVQVMAVLLDNAIKYSEPHTTVCIAGAASDKNVMLSVADEGMGIDADHLPHIFDRFYRADQARSKQAVDGYGLGLAIAKAIIEQHHGYITVASQPGKGTTFTVTIPQAL
ncbi:MAG TPA: ATP-binding protein [Candidatus Saccharimonadales bacterium]|jgi:signal transduction histidine kinase|nr:ATP-binding protein [Candidatus Saccharimonadales bacterium]